MFSDDNPDDIVDLLLAHRPGGIIFTTMGLREVRVPPKLLTHPCVLANCQNKGSRLPAISLTMKGAIYRSTGIAGCRVSSANLSASARQSPGNFPSQKRAGARLSRGIDPDTLDHCYMQFGDEHYRDIPDILLAHIHEGKPSLIRLFAVTTVLPLWCIRPFWQRDTYPARYRGYWLR
jgi:hypothetical protein